MDEISKSVAHNISTGQYYRDARKWYAHKYLYPIAERSLLMMVALCTLVIALIVLYNFNGVFPLKKEVPFIVKVEDSIDYYSVIKPLAKESEDTQKMITEYLISDYVITYEAYNFRHLAKQEQHIKASSSKQVFKAFASLMSTDNPESPILVYQKSSTKAIKVLSVSLVEDEQGSNRASVLFEATIDDRLKRTKTTLQQQADLAFTISNITDIVANKEPLEFIITDYQVRPIK